MAPFPKSDTEKGGGVMEKNTKPIQVVIAHPMAEEQQRIAALLKREGIFRVRHMTHDGLDCLREAVSIQPELLILNMVLDKVDGLEVLRRLKEFPLPHTKCLMLTDYNGYLRDQALLCGADYCLLTPCADGVLAERVRMLVLPPAPTHSDEAIDAATVLVLRTMGVSDHLKGYAYVLNALRILVRDPDLIRQRRVTRDLYIPIAENFGIPRMHIERTMRTLTNRLFQRGDREHLAQYFSASDIQQGSITNSDFLTAVLRLVTKVLKKQAQSENRQIN